MSGPVRVVLADDHPMFRFGLRAALDAVEEVEVVGEAADGAELVALVARLRPDVALTDLAMPGTDGTTAVAQISARFPDVATLVLTMSDSDDAVLGALRAGARGYLLKDARREEIVLAIRTVAAGSTVFGARVGRRVVHGATTPPTSPADLFPGLTRRETQVLELVAVGRSNREIARSLSLAEKTVRNVVATVLAKLGLRDRTAAVLLARERGLGVAQSSN
ncbi:response regulator [Cellulosimicrobium marinum]|uniref:response regulator n=1 Tax=Cellulosimicrobium marinum TaxID=1638992 RepID=UPI001E3396FF|nr:response regulator transcription factor [Cellulosimicrobium marinum]MCB7137012.1 response regulator transcription factor [Cellulosimicrobium marinum]